MSNYADINNEVVVNVVLADVDFAESHGLVLCPDEVGIGWRYIDTQFLPPDYSQQNKQQAEALLQQTDWTATVDINNPEYSNPYLGNQPEFLAYRSQVRAIAVNPPTTPAIFPAQPDEVWVSV